MFLHPCEICGDPHAAWGYGVKLRAGKPYCEFHQAVSLGEGTPSERDAISAAKAMAARGA